MTVWQALGRALSPVEERPRLASDVESAAYTTRSGAPYVVIHNPTATTYARLDPREFELLSLMDGRHSVKELVVAYYQRNGVLALARVAGLVGLLRQQEFLLGAADVYSVLKSRLRGQRLARKRGELTTTAFDGALDKAYRAWGHIFFHREWLVLGLLLGIVGPVLVLIELVRGRYTLYEVDGSAVVTVALLVLLAVFALAVHELGHGLAVKHAGRRVHQAGVRLYFGLPAAYVDTTDVWMASPSRRLVTAFAGPWTGLVIGGLCAIAATAVGGGFIGTFLFTAAFVFLVDNLFNFNPLLELDGYYMLIDFLDRPLLRQRSMAFVRGPFWARIWRRQALTSEERLEAAFGLGAVAYSALAIVLAVRAWQALLEPVVVDNLLSPDRLRQVVGVVILAAVLVPLVLALLVLLRGALGPVTRSLGRMGGRAAEHRHREALAALRAVPVFAELPLGRLLEIARAMRAEEVRTGDAVVRQGALGDRFYLIAGGAFEVVVDDRPLSRLGPGDFFGERALLSHAPRAASVVADEPGRLFVLDRTDFDALLASDLSVRSRVAAALAYRDELADMPLFQDLSPGELDVVLPRLIPLSVSAGEVVIRQGAPGERFYVVRSGEVEVERDGTPLARLGRGEAFGEIALLLDVPRTATVRAMVDTTLLALEARDFHDVLAGYLGRAVALERLSHLRLLSHKRLDEVVQRG